MVTSNLQFTTDSGLTQVMKNEYYSSKIVKGKDTSKTTQAWLTIEATYLEGIARLIRQGNTKGVVDKLHASIGQITAIVRDTAKSVSPNHQVKKIDGEAGLKEDMKRNAGTLKLIVTALERGEVVGSVKALMGVVDRLKDIEHFYQHSDRFGNT